jgi:hypothetical protein
LNAQALKGNEMNANHNRAKEIAKKSSYDQIAWRDRSGVRHEERVTAESVKAAMLAAGTKGRFTVYSARTGTPLSITWRLAVAYFANLKRGYYAHG